MSLKIYTKTGDQGMTALIGGTKVSKADLRIESYGTVDELNAQIGLCRELLTDRYGHSALLEIQDRLFTIGSLLACSPGKAIQMVLPDLHPADCQLLETAIDRMEQDLEPMKSFILPGGAIVVAQLHIARCVCRRAERCCVRLSELEPVPPIILQYLNRLSDYLFVLARHAAHSLGVADIPWTPRKA